jgi:hypothetical protein
MKYHEDTNLRCLDCRKVFLPNMNGLSDSGVKRPQCPKCLEEIDLEGWTNQYLEEN